MLEQREHTPDCLTKTVLGNFFKVHRERFREADEDTRETGWDMLLDFYVSTLLLQPHVVFMYPYRQSGNLISYKLKTRLHAV